jgi:hypothetical protein
MSDADKSDPKGAAKKPGQDASERTTWLDGMSPEEQLQALDRAEAHIRGVWAASPGWGKTAFGELEGAVGRLEAMRNRIRAGLHPIRYTAEEEAEIKEAREAGKRNAARRRAEIEAEGTWFKGPNWRPKEED